MKYEPPYDDFDLTAKPSTLKMVTSSSPSNVTFVDFKRKKVMPAQDDKSEKIKRILASVANFTNTTECLSATPEDQKVYDSLVQNYHNTATADLAKAAEEKKALQVILDRAAKLDW